MLRRKTKQRELILEALHAAEGPLSPTEILTCAGKSCKTLSIATVYRALKLLIEERRIVAVCIPGEPDRYEAAHHADHHHHHFQCDHCHKVFHLDGCPDGLPSLLPDGFSLSRHEITLYGSCNQCKTDV